MTKTAEAPIVRAGGRDWVLGRLIDDVDLARFALRCRLDSGRPGEGPRLAEARKDVKTALDALVQAFHARRLPVPRKINDELRLLTRLCEHSATSARRDPRS